MFFLLACQLLLLTISIYFNAPTIAKINTSGTLITCKGHGDCHIDCTVPPGCIRKIINGSYASALIVNCAGGCGAETSIYCPYLDHTECTVTTDTHSTSAVAGTNIHLTANITNSFTLQCNAQHACQSVNVRAAHNVHQISAITLECDAEYSCNHAIFNFTGITIINYLILNCFGNAPCTALQFNGSQYILTLKLNGDITNYSKINATVGDSFTFDANIFSETNIYINASNNVFGNVFGKFSALTLRIDGNKTHPSSNVTFDDNELVSSQHPSNVKIVGMNVVSIHCKASKTCTSSVFTVDNCNQMDMICGNGACSAIKLYSYYVFSMSLNGYISSSNLRAIIYDNFTINSHSFSQNNIFITVNRNNVNGYISGGYNYTNWTIEAYANTRNSNISFDNCNIGHSNFNFTHINVVNINCNQTNSCVGDILNATETNQFNMICNGTIASNTCKDITLYAPYSSINATSIQCIGTHNSCSGINTSVSNDYSYNFMDFSVVPSTNIAANIINFKCSKTKYDMIDKRPTGTDICGYNMTNKQYICHPGKTWKSCCPWIEFAEYKCKNNADCNVNCSSISTCEGSYINGSIATLLNVTCDYNHVCRNTLIECPINGKCLIYCNKSHSCANAQIMATNTSEIEIFCQHNYACANISISATYAKYLTVTASLNYSLYNATIYALNANKFQLICIGKNDQYSCLNNNYYISSQGFDLDCYGVGCKYIGNIFVWNSIEKATFKINGCKKCDCLTDCISFFNIFCGLYSEYSPTHMQYINSQHDELFTNSSCSNNTCGCNVLKIEGLNNFVDNLNDIKCPHGKPNNKAGVGILSIGVAVIVLCAIFICVFVYCLYRVMPYGRKKKKKKKDYLNTKR